MTKQSPALPWRAIFLESGLVVFGLVIALLANSWLDGRRAQARADAAMAAVVSEIRANQTLLHETIQYHGEVLGALAEFAGEHRGDAEAVAPWRVFSQGFILPANTTSHAWDTASVTGSIEHVPYERLLEVSNLYEVQERYQSLLQQVSRDIYSQLFAGGRESLRRNWRNHQEVLGALVFRECSLAWEYEEALPKLDPVPASEVAVPQYCGYFEQSRQN